MNRSLFKRISGLLAIILVCALAVPVTGSAYTQDFYDNSMGGWQNMTVAPNPGTASVSGGQLNITAPLNTDVHVVDSNSPSIADGSYSFRMLPMGGRAGGMFRYTSESSYVWVGYEYSDSAGHWRIREAGNSANDVFFTTAPLNGSTWYNVKIRFTGNKIIVWLNNSQVYSGTLASMTTTGAGKVGFVVWSQSSASFNNVLVQNSSEISSYSDDFARNNTGGWNKTDPANTGSVSVSSAQLNVSAPTNVSTLASDANSLSLADGIYSFDMLPGVGRLGGVFRYSSDNSHLWVGYEYSDSLGHWRIREAGNLAGDVFFTSPPLNGSTWYNVKIQYVGKQITVWLNNSQIYSGELSGLTTTGAGKAGFVVWSQGSAGFDNVVQQGVQTIANGTLSVTLDKNFPQPLVYKLSANGALLHGADGFASPQININGTNYSADVTAFTFTANSASYTVNVPGFNVNIGYSFTLDGNALVRTMTDISGPGEPNVQTVRITSPVMKATADQSGASAAYYSGGTPGMGGGTDVIGTLGSLGATAQSTPWAYVYTSAAVGAVYNNLAITPNTMEIAGTGSSKYAAIYDNEYNYRFHSIKPGVWFQSKTFIGGDGNANGTVDWQDGALWTRSQLPQMPVDLAAFYANGGDWSQAHMAFPRAGSPIPESTIVITRYPVLVASQRKLYYQTDGLSKQSYETVGWQYRGHDWNWPDWADQQLNPGLEGRAKMDWARTELNKYNGDLSFHLNADSMSELSNAYSAIPDILAKDAGGNKKLAFGPDVFGYTAWYISYFKDLAKGTALSRTSTFVSQYWAPKIVYQDVMLPHTSEDVGYTTNDEWYALKKEVEHWRSLGTYVTTEYYAPEKRRNGGFSFKRYATTSVIDHFINAGVTILQNNFYSYDGTPPGDQGEEYDKLFGYMVSSRERGGNWGGMYNLMETYLVNDHYLQNLTNSTMRKFSAQEYTDDATKQQVRWGSDLIASFDKATKVFTLKQGSVTIATGGDRFIPSTTGENKIYVYSRDGGTRAWTLPSSWSGATKVNRFELTDAGKSFVDQINVVGGAVTLTTPAARPYVLEPGGSSVPPVGPVDNALNRTATASSSAGADVPSNAVDGNSATKWTAGAADANRWLQVDFPRETLVNRAVVSEVGNNVTAHSVQYWDGAAWITAFSGAAIGTQATDLFPEFRTTKVRLKIDATAAQPSISEFRLFADQNLAWTATASASSNSTDGYLVGSAAGGFTYRYDVQASRAMDGTTESFWIANNQTNGAWLQADLKTNTGVDRVVLSENGSSITGFRLQSWNATTSSWQDFYTGTTIGAMKEINVSAFTTTKVRLLVDTATAAPSINEFRIYKVGGVRTP